MVQDASKVKGFFLYFDQCTPINDLSIEQRGKLLTAMIQKFQGNEYEFDDSLVKIAFRFFEQTFNRDSEAYIKKCNKNKQIAQERERVRTCTNVNERTPENTNVNERNHNKIKQNKNKTKQNIDSIIMGTPTAINSKKFTPPSVEEVQDYCTERNNGVDAQRFVDFYTANGWMVGKNKVKDWKACVRTWERNSYQSGQNSLFSRQQQVAKPKAWDVQHG